MPDIDRQALFATFQKLLELQARIARNQTERDRWVYDARAREQQHQQLIEQLKREFAAALHELRKQLGLPDIATTLQDAIKSVGDLDVHKLFGDLFGDFFKTSPPST